MRTLMPRGPGLLIGKYEARFLAERRVCKPQLEEGGGCNSS